jgi:hypothetical protein
LVPAKTIVRFVTAKDFWTYHEPDSFETTGETKILSMMTTK